jgi:hypothetical protein
VNLHAGWKGIGKPVGGSTIGIRAVCGLGISHGITLTPAGSSGRNGLDELHKMYQTEWLSAPVVDRVLGIARRRVASRQALALAVPAMALNSLVYWLFWARAATGGPRTT